MTHCVLCHREVMDNIDPQKAITCVRCVQGLLTAARQNKMVYREKLISDGKLEEARAIESFIIPEENITDEPTKDFRRTLVRKRPMPKARPSYGKKAVP